MQKDILKDRQKDRELYIDIQTDREKIKGLYNLIR